MTVFIVLRVGSVLRVRFDAEYRTSGLTGDLQPDNKHEGGRITLVPTADHSGVHGTVQCKGLGDHALEMSGWARRVGERSKRDAAALTSTLAFDRLKRPSHPYLLKPGA